MKRDLVEEMYVQKESNYFSLEREVFKNSIQGEQNLVLDIGCGTGALGAYLIENRNCLVYGIEINQEAFELSKFNLTEVYKANIEVFDLPFQEDYFDYIILGDVLEHLINPVNTLKKLHNVLKPGGEILITVPNVRHWSVLLKLIFLDEWKYESWGILDFTHLRFFTKKSITQLLKANGFEVVSKRIIQSPSKSSIFNMITFNLFSGLLASHTFVSIKK